MYKKTLYHILQIFTRPLVCEQKEIQRQILECLPANGSQKVFVLDFGCGDGLHRSCTNVSSCVAYVGVDRFKPAVIRARRNFPGSVFLAGDQRLCFRDGSIDFVILANVLHHMSRAEADTLIRDLCRVMKKTGRISLIEAEQRIKQQGFFFRLVTSLEMILHGSHFEAVDVYKDYFSGFFDQLYCRRLSDNFYCLSLIKR
ncbi:MAG TPA: class I SAM-dependent methyltransferase [Candidatus Omnitrophota bacterium]|nr:class I SAM-dependent methyltransferase [Candidatus Omnitrophota bacterium]